MRDVMMRERSPATASDQSIGRRHSLTMDRGWRDVADTTLEWMASQRLSAARGTALLTAQCSTKIDRCGACRLVHEDHGVSGIRHSPTPE